MTEKYDIAFRYILRRLDKHLHTTLRARVLYALTPEGFATSYGWSTYPSGGWQPTANCADFVHIRVPVSLRRLDIWQTAPHRVAQSSSPFARRHASGHLYLYWSSEPVARAALEGLGPEDVFTHWGGLHWAIEVALPSQVEAWLQSPDPALRLRATKLLTRT